MESILEIILLTLTGQNLLLLISMTIIGMFLGAIPGLSATMAVAIFVPITFGLDTVPALISLGALYKGAIYGGCLPAILLKTPGTPASAATAIDGYAMTEKGEGGKAIVYATFFSTIGGLVGTIALLTIAPPLSRIALMFGPSEDFWLAIFGLTIIAAMTAGNLVKGLISASFGLFLGTIGISAITGGTRFTFGISGLNAGIQIVPALIGLFSISQAIILMEKKGHKISEVEVEDFPFIKFINEIKGMGKKLIINVIRSSIIGTIIGMIPGAGAVIAGFISYDFERRGSKNPQEFGKGRIEGVIAAETANNAVTGSSLIPLLTLGIPGNAVSAVFLGGLMIHGLRPGPQLFAQEGSIIYPFILAILFANIIFGIVGIKFGRYIIKVTRIECEYISPLIIIFSIIGSYAIRNTTMDILVMLVIGLFGYVFSKYDYSLSAVVLGLILGPIAENGIGRVALMTDNYISHFMDRPITIVLIVLTILSLLAPFISNFKNDKAKA